MIGKLIIGAGTLSCGIIGNLKQDCGEIGLTQFIGIDTHEEAPELQQLAPEEQVLIGEIPIQEIYQRPADYGKMTEGIFLDQLENHPPDVKQGGCLNPTVTNLALRYHYEEIESAIDHAITILRAPENELTGIDVWVIGSPASTTGRGILLEICITLRQILRKYSGLTATLSVVVIGAQGLKPDKIQQRRNLEAGFWLEYNAAMESTPIPRPHAVTDTLWQGHIADYTYYVCAHSQSFALKSLEQLADWTRHWMFYTVFVEDVRSEITGARIRYRPQIAGYDQGKKDPKRTFLSTAGLYVLTQQLADARAYAKAQLGNLACLSILGDPPADTGSLTVSLELYLASLQERLGYANYDVVISQERKRMMERLINEHWAKRFGRSFSKKWRDIVDASFVNAQQQIKNAQDLTPTAWRELYADLAERIERSVSQTRGIKHITKVLEDLQNHLAELYQQTVKELRTLRRIDQTRTEINDIIENTNWHNHSKQQEELNIVFQHINDAVKIVLNDSIIRLIDELSNLVKSKLALARAILANLERASVQLIKQGQKALTRTDCPVVEYLLADAEVKKLADKAITSENITLLRDTIVKRASDDGNLLDLNEFDTDRIIELMMEETGQEKYIGVIDDQDFLKYFNRKYQTESEKEEFFRRLIDRANAVGGSIDPGYSQKTRNAESSADEQMRIFIPSCMMSVTESILSRVVPRMKDGSLVAVDGLGLILATREVHHIPLHAQKYFRDIEAQMPRDKIQRARFLTSEWALQVTGYVPHEAFEDWNSRELLILGQVFDVVKGNTEGLMYSDPNIGVPVELGQMREAIRVVSQNGHREDILKLVADFLRSQSWSDCENRFRSASDELPQYRLEIRPVYYKLKREYDHLFQQNAAMPLA